MYDFLILDDHTDKIMGKPSIYPTGVTIYDKEKAYNGYTVYNSEYGAAVIDMNGRLVKVWEGVETPLKPMPDGNIMGSLGQIPGPPGAASKRHLFQLDWNGKVVWHFTNNKKVKTKDGEEYMASAHHHDFEREGCSPGYYTPVCEPMLKGGKTLILTHNRKYDLAISDKSILDERIIEVEEDGRIIWEWNSCDHVDEFGLDEAARKAIFAYPAVSGDWIHINSIAALGPNQYYDAGDLRFAPENIICSSKQLSIIFIIEKATGKVVWRTGPNYNETPEMRKLGQIIGQHCVHMIPKGLPGEGHIMVFDNGAFGGYGSPTGCAPTGIDIHRRHYSRVIEFDPVTLEIVWEYSKAIKHGERVMELGAGAFSSSYISSAQRLPNGNTLIDSGADGIFIEVTHEKEIVWEFVNPIPNPHLPDVLQLFVYRAYRIPYEWIPQLEKPEEISVQPVNISEFRVPGSFPLGDKESVSTKFNF
ncbi:MAG: thioredoxin [Lachnospiraceae bacterium]|nr:thioredoxin [Lachnospiraceae bacterium]